MYSRASLVAIINILWVSVVPMFLGEYHKSIPFFQHTKRKKEKLIIGISKGRGIY